MKIPLAKLSHLEPLSACHSFMDNKGVYGEMTKTAAIIQIILVLLVVGISTYYFFRGNFEVGLAFCRCS